MKSEFKLRFVRGAVCNPTCSDVGGTSTNDAASPGNNYFAGFIRPIPIQARNWFEFSIPTLTGGSLISATLELSDFDHEGGALTSGGAALWMETQNVEPDSIGNYTVLLGAASAKGIPEELFVSGEARWLGVQVEGRAEQPRVLLVSVPYALKAGDAETLGGLPPSAFAAAGTSGVSSSGVRSSRAPSSSLPILFSASSAPSLNTSTDPTVTTAGGTVNFVAKFDTPSDIKTTQIFDNGTNVGIGFPVTPTPAPVAKLDVNGSANVRGTVQLPATGTANSTTKGL